MKIVVGKQTTLWIVRPRQRWSQVTQPVLIIPFTHPPTVTSHRNLPTSSSLGHIAPSIIEARDASGSLIKDAKGNPVMISLDSSDGGFVKEDTPNIPEGTSWFGFSEEFVEFFKYS